MGADVWGMAVVVSAPNGCKVLESLREMGLDWLPPEASGRRGSPVGARASGLRGAPVHAAQASPEGQGETKKWRKRWAVGDTAMPWKEKAE